MADVPLGEITDAIRLAWELIGSIKGGTYFEGDLSNDTGEDLTLVAMAEWQGNFYDSNHTMDDIIHDKRGDVWLHGINGGLDGSFSAGIYQAKSFEVLVGGWITNSAIGSKMILSKIGAPGTFGTSKHDLYHSPHWRHNHDVETVQTYPRPGKSPIRLVTSLTTKTWDPPRWGGHWQLSVDSSTP